MMTRKQFGGKLLSAVAAGTLANFSLVAEAVSLSSLERGLNAKCNDNGKSDQCHGAGAKSDTEKPEPPAPPDPEPPQPEPPQPEPPKPPEPPEPPACKAPAPDAEPACKADTCSQADAPTGNE